MSFKVDFLIVGAQKSGTTSLHRYLSMHPKVYMPPNKELDFFSSDSKYELGEEYYSKFFTDRNCDQLIGEVSPQYMYKISTASRIYKHNPNCKIIMILRNPVDRAYSHYRMNVRRGIENKSFSELVDQYKNNIDRDNCKSYSEEFDSEYGYFELGEYGRILSGYLNVFPKNQILVVFTEDLKNNRLGTLNKIQDFLCLRRELSIEEIKEEYHVGGSQRIPYFYKTVGWMSSNMPLASKKFLIYLFGKNNIYTFLHRLETEWTIKKENVNELNSEFRKSIALCYKSDYQILNDLIKADSLWDDFKECDVCVPYV